MIDASTRSYDFLKRVLAIALLFAPALAWASDPILFHSPVDDGVSVGTPTIIAPGDSTLHVYVDGGETPSTLGKPCNDGDGDELCKVLVEIIPSGTAELLDFHPMSSDIRFVLEPDRLRVLSGDALRGDLGPTKLGDLMVRASSGDTLAVTEGEAVGASLDALSIPKGPLVVVPEPTPTSLLGAGIFGLTILSLRRRGRSMRSRSCGAVSAAGLLLFGGSAMAQEVLIGVDFDTQDLVHIDASSGAGMVVGTTAARAGLSCLDGRLFGVSNADEFLELDPNTGATLDSFSPGMSGGAEGAMAVRSDGVAFVTRRAVSSSRDELWRVDISGMSAVRVRDDMEFLLDGLAFDSTDRLYGLSQSDGVLYRVDPESGDLDVVGETGVSLATTSGIAFTSDDTLYLAAAGDIYRISTVDGSGTYVGAIGVGERYGGLAACSQAGLVFSLDIGSDKEISDPGSSGPGEELDPGDLYRSSGIVGSTADAVFLDDAVIFGMDPAPVQGDPSTAVPIGDPSVFFKDFFDLDGYDALAVSLDSLGINGLTLASPILRRGALETMRCIHEPEVVLVSFQDDDSLLGWRSSTATRVPTEDFPDWGMTDAPTEVVAIRPEHGVFDPSLPPPDVTETWVPHLSESGVHADLWLNPDPILDDAQKQDDDVDGLDYSDGDCRISYFSVDDEGNLGWSPASIYEVNPVIGPIERISAGMLGLAGNGDVDAFEFGWVALPDEYGALAGERAFAVLFSVDYDKPSTFWDESGGLDPPSVYVSFLDGVAWMFLSNEAYQMDVDAIALLPSAGCGDFVPGEGGVNGEDRFRLEEVIVNPPDWPAFPGVSPVSQNLCPLFGEDDGRCDLVDLVVLDRAVHGLGPGIQQSCPAERRQ
jgi:hypothetical protein